MMPLNNKMLSEVSNLSAVALGLEAYRESINASGMSRELAVTLECYKPGIFNGVNINSFTLNPSATKMQYALEAIDWTKAGVVTAIVGVILTGLYKFFKWIADKISSLFGDKNVSEDIETAEKAVDKIDAAINSAKPVPPSKEAEKKMEKEGSKSPISETVRTTEHILNPIMELINKVGAANKKEGEIKKAAEIIGILHTRFGDGAVGLLTALASDVNGQNFGGLLMAYKATATEPFEGISTEAVSGIVTATNAAASIMSPLIGICNRLKTGREGVLEISLQQIELTLMRIIKEVNGNVNSGLLIKVSQLKSTKSRDTQMIHSTPVKYDAIVTEKAERTNTFIAEKAPLKYGIWGGDGITSPVDNIEWFRKLADKDTVKAVATQKAIAKKNTTLSLQDYGDLAKKLSGTVAELKATIDKLKGNESMGKSLTYSVGDDGEFESSPAEIIARSLSLAEAINRFTSKQIMAYCSVDNASSRYVKAVSEGAAQYLKAITK